MNNNQNFVVMSDFHGEKDALNVVNDYINKGKMVYILGDATDRGKDGVEILLEIMRLHKEGKVVYIPGNHDQFVYNFYRGTTDVALSSASNNLFANGGYETWEALDELKDTDLKKLDELLDWLGSLPLQKEVECNNKKYCLAHALFNQKFYNEKPNLCLNDLADQKCGHGQYGNILWFRKYKKGHDCYVPEELPGKDSIMIIGHTPTEIEDSKEFNLQNEKGEEIQVINVDGGLHGQKNGKDMMIVFDSEDGELRLVSTSIEKQKQSEKYINKVVSNKKLNTKEVVVESSEIPSIAEQFNKSSSSIHPSNDEMHYAGMHILSQDAMEPAIDEEQCKALFKILSSNFDVEREDLKKDGNITDDIDHDYSLLQSRETELSSNVSLPKSRVSEIIKEVIRIREKYHLAIDGVDEIAEFVKKNDISLDDEYLRKVKNFNQQLKEKYEYGLSNDLSSEGVQDSKKLESLELPVENNSSILSSDKCKELLKILEPALDGKFIEYANNHYSDRENFSAPEKFKLFEQASDDSKYFEDIKEKLLKANSISVEEAKKIADKIKEINESWLQYIRPDKKKWSEPRYDEDKVNEFFKSINNPDDVLGKNSVNPVLESKSVESVDVLDANDNVIQAGIKANDKQSLNHSDVEQTKLREEILKLLKENYEQLEYGSMNSLAYVDSMYDLQKIGDEYKKIAKKMEEIGKNLELSEVLSKNEILEICDELDDFYKIIYGDAASTSIGQQRVKEMRKLVESVQLSDEENFKPKDLSSGIESSSNIDKVLLNLVESLSEKLGEQGTKKTISGVDKGKYSFLQEKLSELAKKIEKGESLTERDTNFLNNILSKFPEIVDEIQQNNLKNELSDIELQEASSDKIKVHQSSENSDINKNNETYELVVKLLNELKQLKDLTPLNETQVKIDCAKLKSILKKIEDNKIEEKDQKKLFEIFNKYSEKMREIEPDEEKLNAIKVNLLVDSKKEAKDEPKVMQSVSDEQISSLIEDLYNEIKDLYENPDGSMDQNDVYGKLVALEMIKSSLKNQTLSSQDKQNIKDIFKFVEENVDNSNIATEENQKIIEQLNADSNSKESNSVIDAILTDLYYLVNHSNEFDNYDEIVKIIPELEELKNKENLSDKDLDMIKQAVEYINLNSQYIPEPEIKKDEFKEFMESIKQTEKFDTKENNLRNFIKFIEDAIDKIDDEVENSKKSGFKKVFEEGSLNKKADELDVLREKLQNGEEITDKDVENFRKILNNKRIKDILNLSDEDKDRYIENLDDLVDKENGKRSGTNQSNADQSDVYEDEDAEELEVDKVEKDKKTYLKAVAGVAGFAFGAVLGYAVPFPAGLVVTYGIQAAKIISRVASRSLEGKDNKITKIISNVKEKHPKITKFIKSSYVKWAFNGFTAGYTIGTIANKLHKPNLDKVAGGDNSKPHHTPDGTTAPDKTPISDGVVHDPTGVGDEPEKIVNSLQKGDRWNIRKVAGGYGYDSSTMDRRVHLDKNFTNDVIIGKSKIVDGEKMVLVKDNKTKEALAWLKESDILNQGRRR